MVSIYSCIVRTIFDTKKSGAKSREIDFGKMLVKIGD